MTKKRKVGRSFRIYEKWNKVLEEDAKNQGISVNALMNKILQEYSLFQRHVKKYGTITLSHKAFATLLNGCSDEWINAVAEELGSTLAKDGMLMMGLPFDQESLVFIITNLGEHGGQYKVSRNQQNGEEMLHLRHNLGKKWSIYVAGAMSGMFNSVLNKEVETEIFDDFVTIKFNL